MSTRRINVRHQANAIIANALLRVADALERLDQMDCHIHAVAIRDGRPALLIATPTAPIPGAVLLHTRSQGKREALWVAEVASVRVEWTAPAFECIAGGAA